MSEPDDGGRRDDQSPDSFEDTVVEILGFDEDAADAETPGAKVDAKSDVARPGQAERKLEHELDAQKERYLRLRADFDNFRKRTERERGEIERYALAEPIRELLPVVDNLERALAAPGGGEDLRKGVEMILRQLEELLRRFGLVPIQAVGERFDPSMHEAVLQVESSDVAMPTVAAELQRGYRLNDRLLRPALVKVAVPRESSEARETMPSQVE